MRSLRMKLVMILVILILALMTVIGAFLINGVGNFYISEFYVQMEQTFSQDFISQLQRLAQQSQDAPREMKELLMAQSGLGIDISGRNVYILSPTGDVLTASDQETSVDITANILTAMNGEIGQDSSITSGYMDLAVPIKTDSGSYIVYVRDSKATVDKLTGQVLNIILQALALGLVICLVLSFLLAQILITPIRALTIGTRQVAAGDELPPELHNNFMGVIVSEADRMTRIVQDLLTLSKIDYGKMEMNVSRFSFSKAVRSVYEAVALNAESHGHTLTFSCEENMPDVDGDRERIEQVIMNIVSNAIKYTPDGGKIAITAATSGRNVFVRISDNGIGIPEKDLPRLFERFYRVDKARSRESGGTGLGLSIAKEILNQHKGDIRIESVYGEGTDVTITLPAARD